MPSLKDYIQSDLNIFFNENEMAEKHNINGTMMVIIPDSEKLAEYKQVDGISSDMVAYNVLASAFSRVPKIGEYQSYDGRSMTIIDVSISEGILLIVATAYSSNIG